MALLCASAVAAARLAPLAQPLAHSSRLVRSLVIRGAVEDAWSAAEDAALLERTPAFTCGDGASTVTFWSALAVATPALARRSPLDFPSIGSWDVHLVLSRRRFLSVGLCGAGWGISGVLGLHHARPGPSE